MYYCVTAKCGHVGRNFYVLKDFAIKAESAKEAAAKARLIPRVKHHHKDAIRNVVKLNEIDYQNLKENNGKDPYFSCFNIQQQRKYDKILNIRIPETSFEKHKTEKNIKYILKKQKQQKIDAYRTIKYYLNMA